MHGFHVFAMALLSTLGAPFPAAPTSPGARAASPEPELTQAPESDQPRIRLSEAEIDFGELLQGQIFDYTVTVYNDGDALLTISQVVPSCRCTTVKSYDGSIAAGKSGTIVFEVNSKMIKPGKTKKNFKIFNNDPTAPRLVFWFYAECRSLFVTRPREIKLSGILDQPKEAEVELMAATDLGFEILKAESRGGRFEILKLEEVEKDRRYRARLRAGTSDAAGLDRDPLDLTIRVRDGRTVKVGTWVNIEHRDHIQVQPSGSLKFLNRDTDKLLVDGAPPVVKTVTLSSVLPETRFKITGVRLEGMLEGRFQTETKTVVEGRRYLVNLILSEYQDKSFVRGKLIIETDDPRKPSHELSVQALFGKRRRG